jgi:hypothetical protein
MSIQFHYSRQSIRILRLSNSYLRKRVLLLEKKLEESTNELNILRGKYDRISKTVEVDYQPVQVNEVSNHHRTGKVYRTISVSATEREACCQAYSEAESAPVASDTLRDLQSTASH